MAANLANVFVFCCLEKHLLCGGSVFFFISSFISVCLDIESLRNVSQKAYPEKDSITTNTTEEKCTQCLTRIDPNGSLFEIP